MYSLYMGTRLLVRTVPRCGKNTCWHGVMFLLTFYLFRYNQLSTQLDMKTREVELIEERLKQSTHHVKVEELKAHENCIGK